MKTLREVEAHNVNFVATVDKFVPRKIDEDAI